MSFSKGIKKDDHISHFLFVIPSFSKLRMLPNGSLESMLSLVCLSRTNYISFIFNKNNSLFPSKLIEEEFNTFAMCFLIIFSSIVIRNLMALLSCLSRNSLKEPLKLLRIIGAASPLQSEKYLYPTTPGIIPLLDGAR